MACRRLARAVVAVAVLAVAVSLGPASAEEWLANGGFEAGTSGWVVSRGTAVACTPFEGSGALGTTVASGGTTIVRQEATGALPTGAYTLSGWTRVQQGAAEISAVLAFNRPVGVPGGITVPQPIVTGSEYTRFSLTANAGFVPESVLVAFHIATDSAAEVCFDSIELTTPGSAPSPTATATPSEPSATPTSTPTTQPSVPTATPATPGATPTTPGATPTPTLTLSPSPTPGPTFTFINGGFEQGLTGWSKFGGLLTTTSDALSGSLAGLLVSETDSTKWAYQPVAIDPSLHYEFAGSLRAGDGVREAYLRISWYPTTDASGPAMGTTDSLDRLSGAGAGFVFLTTRPVQPPAGAASARVRVLLVPEGVSPATLTIDDVSFAVVSAPAPTPSPTGTASATATAAATSAVPLLGALPTSPEAGAGPASSSDSGGAPAPGTIVDTRVQAVQPPPTMVSLSGREPSALAAPSDSSAASEPPRNDGPAAPRERRADVPWAWLAGIALVAIGLGGTWLQRKQTPR